MHNNPKDSEVPFILFPAFKVCLLLSIPTPGHIVSILSFPDHSNSFLKSIFHVAPQALIQISIQFARMICDKNLILSLSLPCLKLLKILTMFRIEPKVNTACKVFV